MNLRFFRSQEIEAKEIAQVPTWWILLAQLVNVRAQRGMAGQVW
jgi:hypothetical protein